jgi:putative oligomerization/nucleic acid binding protein
MRRRPLMRAAMVGGTAYAVGKHAARNEQREYDQSARLDQLEQQQAYGQPAYAEPPAPAPAAPAKPDLATQLTDLQRLVDQGVLTPDEFATAKQKLLAS